MGWQFLYKHEGQIAILIMSGNAAPSADRTNLMLFRITDSVDLKPRPEKDLQSSQNNLCQIFSLYLENILTNSLVNKILDSYMWSFILGVN